MHMYVCLLQYLREREREGGREGGRECVEAERLYRERERNRRVWMQREEESV